MTPIDDKIILCVRKTSSGRVCLALAPFLIWEKSPSNRSVTEASLSLKTDEALSETLKHCGLTRDEAEIVSMEFLQGGLLCPSPAALKGVLRKCQETYRSEPQRVRLVGKRLALARSTGVHRSPLNNRANLLVWTAETQHQTLAAIASLAEHFPDHFEPASLNYLASYRTYQAVLTECLDSRSAVIASGLEAFMVCIGQRLLVRGYDRVRSRKIESVLQRVIEAEAAGGWRTRCLARGQRPSPWLSERLTPRGVHAVRESDEWVTEFCGLTIASLLHLADEWVVMPHLHTDAHKQALLGFCKTSDDFFDLGRSAFAWVCELTMAFFCSKQPDTPVDPALRAVWLTNRKAGSVFLELVQSFGPSVDICRPALLVEESDEAERVRVQPAVEWPEAQLLPEKERGRASSKFDSECESAVAECADGIRLVGAKSLLQSTNQKPDPLPSPHWYLAGGSYFTNGRLHMINSIYACAASAPDLFANLSFLRGGEVSVPVADLHAQAEGFGVNQADHLRNLPTGFLSLAVKRFPHLDARNVPVSRIQSPNHSDSDAGQTTQPLLIGRRQTRPSAAMRVTFQARLSAETRSHLRKLGLDDEAFSGEEGWPEKRVAHLFDLVATALKKGTRDEALTSRRAMASAQPDAEQGSDGSLEMTSAESDPFTDLINAFGGLTLEPRFEFQVGDAIFSVEQWEGAKKVGKDYVVGETTLLTADEYRQCLEIYILRKKALARFGTIGIADIWKVQSYAAQAPQDQIDPLAYLSLLKTNLEPLLAVVNTGLTHSVLTALQDASTKLGGSLAEIRAELRQYQTYGVAWLFTRIKMGLGALLADDMGLGKTLQSIAIIHLIRRSSGGKLPILIVCPKSVAPNWKHEITRFLPAECAESGNAHSNKTLKIRCLDDGAIAAGADLIIASYPQLRRRKDELLSLYSEWDLVILDEAHAIKNADAQITQTVRSLQTRGRLALTGTPVENRASELWSLMDWLNPGVLGKSSEFDSYVRLARSAQENARLLGPVHEILRPVMLRRMKNDPAVDLQLPDKVVKTRFVKLSLEQEILYETVLLTAMNPEIAGRETAFTMQSRLMLALLRLKQICNHPDLFYSGDEEEQIIENEESLGHIDSQKLKNRVKRELARRQMTRSPGVSEGDAAVARSGKMEALADLLDDLRDNDGGILIFTQFRKSAEMICRWLSQTGAPDWQDTAFFHGGLTLAQRERIITDFRERCERHVSIVSAKKQQEAQGADKKRLAPAAPILIISLKAGGVGLNLSCANHVIHFDRWWNPAVEDQATDRAHRIGQTSKVVVTHLISDATIEEGIEALLNSKRHLASDLLGLNAMASVSSLVTEIEGFLGLADPQKHFRGRAMIQPHRPSDVKRNSRPIKAHECKKTRLPRGKEIEA